MKQLFEIYKEAFTYFMENGNTNIDYAHDFAIAAMFAMEIDFEDEE